MAKPKRRRNGPSAKPPQRPARTVGQRAALDELRQLARAYPDIVLQIDVLPRAIAPAMARVRLSTADIWGVPGGLPISEEYEDVLFAVGEDYPDEPPLVGVEHDRFLDGTHVLKGRTLCIYLDPTREWHPSFGMEQAIRRLRDWFDDAANDRFDSRTALFHVFGGVPPVTVGAPTVVIRSSPPADDKPLSLATVRRRTSARIDVVGWRQGRAASPDRNAIVLGLGRTLPNGVGDTAMDLLTQVAEAGGAPPDAVVGAILRLASMSLPGVPLYVFVAVRHPAAPAVVHFACGQIPPLVADQIRAGRLRTAGDLRLVPIEWMPMSDERPEITTRRDSTRPSAAFYGKTVEIWGCGGLGSWIAEFVVRAGAKAVALRDSSGVGGGILSRQNYHEDDIGKPKADQLARRLSSLADGVQVVPHVGSVLDLLRSGTLPDCDVIIDATINESVAARLDEAARTAGTGPLLAQVATDPRTATLGLLVIAGSGVGVGPATIDNDAAGSVLADGGLEQFHGFWNPPSKSDQLVPAAGCSVPTFHGSAADVAVIAGTAVNLIGQHLKSGTSGTHLIAAPVAAAAGLAHEFIPFASTAA
jgi:hypothetical protein